jgi:hypothetical protein
MEKLPTKARPSASGLSSVKRQARNFKIGFVVQVIAFIDRFASRAD